MPILRTSEPSIITNADHVELKVLLKLPKCYCTFMFTKYLGSVLNTIESTVLRSLYIKNKNASSVLMMYILTKDHTVGFEISYIDYV